MVLTHIFSELNGHSEHLSIFTHIQRAGFPHSWGLLVFFFSSRREMRPIACYQFVPVDIDSGLLDLDLVLKPGQFGLFGRKSVSKNFDVVSIAEAKEKTKELFDYSLEALYEKHRR